MRSNTADPEVIGSRIISAPLVGKATGAAKRADSATIDSHHIIWVTRGGGRIYIDGKPQGFGPNTAIFVPAHTLFYLEISVGTTGWQVSVPSALRIPLPHNAMLTLVRKPLQQAQLSPAFASVQSEFITENPLRGTALIYSVGLLAVLFQRLDASENRKAIEKDNAKRRLMRRFITRLNSRYASPDTVRDYAQDLGVTPTHLTRVCRETGGKPATRFIQEKVIEEARHRLAESNEKIARIADELGFQTPAYFSRVFTRRVGMSPRQYRKTRQINDTPS